MMRIGIGYDVHRLVSGRPLVLGGVRIPYHLGLMGHSDADVLTHAVCDALLGAAGLGDLGRHFPDSDEQFKNIYSIELLSRCMQMIRQKGFAFGNVDATIFAQAPKLASHSEAMCTCMAGAMGVPAECINIKATTTEGLGYIGSGEGLAAMAVVLLQKNFPTSS